MCSYILCREYVWANKNSKYFLKKEMSPAAIPVSLHDIVLQVLCRTNTRPAFKIRLILTVGFDNSYWRCTRRRNKGRASSINSCIKECQHWDLLFGFFLWLKTHLWCEWPERLSFLKKKISLKAIKPFQRIKLEAPCISLTSGFLGKNTRQKVQWWWLLC